MIFRPAVRSDRDRFLPLLVPDPASTVTADQYNIRSRNGEYRADWTWIAEESAAEMPLAVAAWWGDPREDRPSALDGIWARGSVHPGDRILVAAGLLNAAHRAYASAGADHPPEYHVFLPADYRDRPDVGAALSWRRAAAERAGLTTTLERLGFEWTQQDGLPDPAGRLRFRAEPDDEVFAGLFRQVLTGTLDATSAKGAAAIGPDARAREEVTFYRDKMLGDRTWWRVAETLDGEAAGFGVPSRNTQFPVVGYLGVLPGHRGRGYSVEILAEITRILVAEAGATTIRADTDLDNRPMAGAFERAGYRNFARRLVLSAR